MVDQQGFDFRPVLNPEHLVVLLAGPISHYSVNNYCRFCRTFLIYWICLFIIISFLTGAESEDKCLLNSEAFPCFSGLILSIRPSLLSTMLLLCGTDFCVS